ncbi:MAG: transporter substrate-binding domain-containing protein [Sulfuricaulis sp.]|uniref:ATP-binding protein n=1 Tax=Sulfuricaulis sp. TaxID=2003553 RepID=UPI0025F80F5E|nr:transporter substrate-binding domain-containing protein [Sulfuricaulis sp.]MCR4345722.1 transporter substrate-binding domain-containing protein [Sulfuricaulis sp.]
MRPSPLFINLLRLLPVILFCLFGTAAAEPLATAEPLDVIAAIPRNSPPEYQLDTAGHPGGFAIELMELIAQRAGLRVTYRVEDNWDEAIRSLREGRADLIPNLGDTEARRKEFGFSSSFETFRVSLFVRNDTFAIRGLTDLAGRRVAVVRANVGETLLKPRPEIHLESYPDFPDALFALLSGNVDALAYPEPWTWNRARGANVADQIKVVGEPLAELKRALAVRVDQQVLLARIEKAVQQVLATPEYRAIYVKWLGEARPFWTVQRIAWAMGSLLLLTVMGMGAWRYRTTTRAYRGLKTALDEQDRTEARRQRVFETASVSLWEQDIAGVRRLIESRRAEVFAGWGNYCDEYPELVAECARALKVLDVNQATLRLYEADSREELLGSIEMIFTDGSYGIFKQELVAIAEGQRQFTTEAINRTLRGKEINILLSVSIPPADSPVQRMVVAVLDITEHKQAEKERERLFHELEQRNREMESFVYTISHDLKSPLITISGFATMLARDLERNDKEQGRESIMEIQKATQGMQDLIEDLLLLSRTGQVQGEPEDVDLHAILGDVQARCASHIERERATIRVVSQLPRLHVDRVRFGQVLQNLLDNGVKFHRKGVDPVLEIGAERTDGEARLYVRDNGIGIEKRYQEKIFGLFERLDTGREGTGVGLTIARRIVEQHGGRLWVESEPGRGSTFWISLPDSVIVDAGAGE